MVAGAVVVAAEEPPTTEVTLPRVWETWPPVGAATTEAARAAMEVK